MNAWVGGRRNSAGSALRRFESAAIEPDRVHSLDAHHPAAVEGRTIFPSTVVSAFVSPRILVSGQNNPKLGGKITKGPRAGWPIFHVTLEERATCPRTCEQWLSCYGSAMHMARRHDALEPNFLWLLKAEVATVARQYPAGLLVRLHTLGDFFSVEYVWLWRELLATFPQLHVFGYTARLIDAPDALSRAVAAEVAELTARDWARFAIRTSHAEVGPERSIVVGEKPTAEDVILCPAQTHATEACGTCGLCWADGARRKTIAFLRHGMKRATGRRQPKLRVEVAPKAPRPRGRPPNRGAHLDAEQVETILAMHGRSVSPETICSIFEITQRQLSAITGCALRPGRAAA